MARVAKDCTLVDWTRVMWLYVIERRSLAKITEATGVADHVLRRWLKDADVYRPRTKRKYAQWERQEAFALHEERVQMQIISRTLDVDQGTLRAWFRAARVPTSRPNRQWSMKDRLRAADLYRTGYSIRQIAGQMKAPEGTVRSWLEAEGVEMRAAHVPGPWRKPITKRRKRQELVVRLYRRDYSCAEIAELLKCHPTTVQKDLKAAGLRARSASEAMKVAYERGRKTAVDRDERGYFLPQAA